MASTEHASLRARAKRAYELGRLRMATRITLPVAAMIAVPLLGGQALASTALAGAVLLALAVGFRFRGQVLGRAVTPGLLAGSAPLLLPLLLRSSGHCCIGGACWSICMLGCIAGGVLAGVAIAWRSAAEKEQRWTFLGAASLLAGAAGVLGCAVFGYAGMTGMAVAVVVSSVPVAVVTRLRAPA